MTQAADIRGFHAHVDFDAIPHWTAERIHDALAQHAGVNVGASNEQPVGRAHDESRVGQIGVTAV